MNVMQVAGIPSLPPAAAPAGNGQRKAEPGAFQSMFEAVLREQARAGGAGGRTATEPPESEAEGQSPTKEKPADDSPTAAAVSAADGMVAWLVPASGLPVNGETPMALEGNGLADDGNPEPAVAVPSYGLGVGDPVRGTLALGTALGPLSPGDPVFATAPGTSGGGPGIDNTSVASETPAFPLDGPGAAGRRGPLARVAAAGDGRGSVGEGVPGGVLAAGHGASAVSGGAGRGWPALMGPAAAVGGRGATGVSVGAADAVAGSTDPAEDQGLVVPAPLSVPLPRAARGEAHVGGPANLAGQGSGDALGQAAGGPGDAGQGMVGFHDWLTGTAALGGLDDVADLLAGLSPGAAGEDGTPAGTQLLETGHRATAGEETIGEAVGPVAQGTNDDRAPEGTGTARRADAGDENVSAARGGGPGATASSGTGPVGAVQEPGGDGSTGLPAYAQPQPVAASDPGAPAAPAASRASVMQQLAGHLQEMVAEMRQEITAGGVGRVAIRLHPEYLGQVVLRISIDRSGTVTAQFAVENPQVRAWIEEELPQLRAALAEHGLQLADANVDSGPGYNHENLFAFGDSLAGWGSNRGPAGFAEEPELGNLAPGTASHEPDEGDGEGRVLAAYGIATIVDLRA